MAVHYPAVRRLLLAVGVAAAAGASPFLGAIAASPSVVPLAQCPAGQSLDPLSGTCSPDSAADHPIDDPINPEGADLQPGSLTSSENGEVGRLPEVNGIPCNGDNTGLCIGLTENNEALGIPGN